MPDNAGETTEVVSVWTTAVRNPEVRRLAPVGPDPSDRLSQQGVRNLDLLYRGRRSTAATAATLGPRIVPATAVPNQTG